MPTRPPTTQQRDDNLQALKKAFDDMATEEISRLDNEAKFMRAVLDGRGVNSTGTQNLQKVVTLVQKSIADFTTVFVKSFE